MSKEAMKLALEALEWCHGGEPCGTAEAITALREALAEQPAQQEPVAWLTQARCFVDVSEFTEAEAKLFGWKPLYTSPPAQRTWVGLTEKEILECRSANHLYFYKAIEAKLKEKNT